MAPGRSWGGLVVATADVVAGACDSTGAVLWGVAGAAVAVVGAVVDVVGAASGPAVTGALFFEIADMAAGG
jgi:hypothetical protein